jgi:hypothetical protein
MSFEDTPEQVATPEVDVPVKKRGRPAGAKNKEPVAKKTTANPLASKLLMQRCMSSSWKMTTRNCGNATRLK